MAKKKNDELIIEHTDVFDWNLDAFITGFRYIVNQGGARSSKTYSILQVLVYLALESKITISIVRSTMPALKQSAMKDFFEILKSLNLYNDLYHNQSDHTYTFPQTGSEVSFFGLNEEQKIRGSKRDILYCNEGNELTYDVFQQLNMRTGQNGKGAIFIDFNPSDSDHFLYDILKQDNAHLIKSTYKDNPFLPQTLIDLYESYKISDPEYYKVFTLGERSNLQTKIYTHFQKYVDEPSYTDYAYGLDFGFNNQTALVKIMYLDKKIYTKELLYESNLTSSDLISKMQELFTVTDKQKPIYCDYARPDLIEDLNRAGYTAKPANKAVQEGIDYLKASEIYLHIDSANLWTEYKLYSWKCKGNIIYDEPVKENDHLLDAMRYAIYTQKKRGSGKFDYHFSFI
jgi:phage terminase large subunit